MSWSYRKNYFFSTRFDHPSDNFSEILNLLLYPNKDKNFSNQIQSLCSPKNIQLLRVVGKTQVNELFLFKYSPLSNGMKKRWIFINFCWRIDLKTTPIRWIHILHPTLQKLLNSSIINRPKTSKSPLSPTTPQDYTFQFRPPVSRSRIQCTDTSYENPEKWVNSVPVLCHPDSASSTEYEVSRDARQFSTLKVRFSMVQPSSNNNNGGSDMDSLEDMLRKVKNYLTIFYN